MITWGRQAASADCLCHQRLLLLLAQMWRGQRCQQLSHRLVQGPTSQGGTMGRLRSSQQQHNMQFIGHQRACTAAPARVQSSCMNRLQP